MCGILGYISNKFLKIDEIDQVQNLMINRGPDYQSFVKKEFSKKNLYLFHSRLSIQDLNMRSNQPFFYKKYILLFNGEIYNFKDLREKLPNKKNLKTLSDTEVIIFMYDLFKEKCFQDFEGMWSIIIYDIERKKIIISRDRFGEKPLFIYNKNNEIVIGSQISYIHKILNQNFKLNSNKVNSFLHFGYKSIFKDNKTFFKNIDYVEKGSIITIDKNFTISEKKFWKPDLKKKNKSNLEEKIFNTRKLIFSAFEKRFISDVPIAACLSGGIDSGAIVSIASKIFNKKIECFSIIDSDSRYNEKKIFLPLSQIAV
jgi:asparagine synthase (glutamine-hydrolysing)